MKNKVKIIASLLLIGLLFGNIASAAIVNCGGYGETGKQEPCGIGDLIGTIRLIVNTLMSWAWLVSILFIVIAGFQMVYSAGNEEAVSKAKTTLTNAITGFVLILVSFVVLNFVVSLLTGSGSFDANALKDSFHLIP